MVDTNEERSIVINEEQFSNALFPIDVTDDGRCIDVNEEHPLKQPFEVFDIVVCIFTIFNEIQFLKQFFSTDEISTDVNDVQPLKHSSPMNETDDGIWIVVNEEQSLNAQSSITEIEDGSSIIDNEWHDAKQLRSIFETVEGIVIDWNEVHS